MIDAGCIPEPVRQNLSKARPLAWWTLFWIGNVALLMYLAMGSSQAMKTAFIEDSLSLVPSIVFLIATSLEGKPATKFYPFGFRRFNSLAFMVAATALLSIGAFTAFEATMTLVRMEHPTIGMVKLFGQELWLGWIMIAALAYSAVPPLILGRKKLPLAQELQDKILFTDAKTQKADWQTALAGIAGVAGIGFGFWWADAIAALAISLSILRDGWMNLKKAGAELADGLPRNLEHDRPDADAEHVRERLAAEFPDADIRMREVGRYIEAEVSGVASPDSIDLARFAPQERSWRLDRITFVPLFANDRRPPS